MKNAVRKQSQKDERHSQTHYLLEYPMKDDEGRDVFNIVVSYVNNDMAHETYIFPANTEGHIVDFGELGGSRKGYIAPDELLNELGYDVHV